eukprot:IDg2229t1
MPDTKTPSSSGARPCAPPALHSRLLPMPPSAPRPLLLKDPSVPPMQGLPVSMYTSRFKYTTQSRSWDEKKFNAYNLRKTVLRCKVGSKSNKITPHRVPKLPSEAKALPKPRGNNSNSR